MTPPGGCGVALVDVGVAVERDRHVVLAEQPFQVTRLFQGAVRRLRGLVGV